MPRVLKVGRPARTSILKNGPASAVGESEGPDARSVAWTSAPRSGVGGCLKGRRASGVNAHVATSTRTDKRGRLASPSAYHVTTRALRGLTLLPLVASCGSSVSLDATPAPDAAGSDVSVSSIADASSTADASPTTIDASSTDADATVEPASDAGRPADGAADAAGRPSDSGLGGGTEAGACPSGGHSCAAACCPFTSTTILPVSANVWIQDIALASGPAGEPHIAYGWGPIGAVVSTNVAYASTSAGSVTTESVATSAGGIGDIAVALDPLASPRIAFAGLASMGVYVFARVGGAWLGPTLADIPQSSQAGGIYRVATGFDSSGRWGTVDISGDGIVYSFADADAGATASWTNHVRLVESAWTVGFAAQVGGPFAIKPQSGVAPLEVARVVGQAWSSQAFGTPPSDAYKSAGAWIDPSGVPVLAGASGATLYRYAGGTWISTTTPLPASAVTPVVDVDHTGQPTVVAYSGDFVYVAHSTPSGWEVGLLGPANGAFALALDSAGAPTVCWATKAATGAGESLVCSAW